MALSYGFCLGADGIQYDSQQFSDAFHALLGNGLCAYGDSFSLTVDGFTATLAPGFAIAAGHWLKSDEPLSLEVPLSGNYGDRTDAISVQVDYAARKTSLVLLPNVDRAAVQAAPRLLRDDKAYHLILYFIHVKRGATVLYPEDITDVRNDAQLCGAVTKLDAVSTGALYIHQFLTSGIDQEVARLLGLSNQVIQRADGAMQDIDSAIQAVAPNAIGDTLISKSWPTPINAWLLCDGSRVPAKYPSLSYVLGGILPSITPADARFLTYIYGGPPS